MGIFKKILVFLHRLALNLVKHLRGSVYEEEDFQPMSYNFKLACEVTDTRAGGMVREVEDDLGRIVRTTKAKEGVERDEETSKEVNCKID